MATINPKRPVTGAKVCRFRSLRVVAMTGCYKTGCRSYNIFTFRSASHGPLMAGHPMRYLLSLVSSIAFTLTASGDPPTNLLKNEFTGVRVIRKSK